MRAVVHAVRMGVMVHDMVSVYLGMLRGGSKSECVLYMSACMYVHTYVCMYVCMFTFMHTCVCMFCALCV